MKHSKNDPTSQPGAKQAPTSEQQATGTEPTAEGAASAASTSDSVDELETMKKALEEVQAKYEQLNDTYLRTLAEYDNYRKRTVKEKADLIKSGGESVLINVLNVVDDLDRGIKAAAGTTDVNAVKEGLELINTKFQSFLKQQGISLIETEGASFDTDHHEAIAMVPAPEESLKGKVLDCVQKGYCLHNKVIRFAKVVVGE